MRGGAGFVLIVTVALLALALGPGADPARPSAGGQDARAGAIDRDEVFELRRDQARERLAFGTVNRSSRKRFLARPPDGFRDWFGTGYRLVSDQTCGPHVCVHWVPATADAPPLTDTDLDGVPDWIESALSTLDEIWRTYHELLGYRETLADDNDPDEIDGRLDVFLADIGSDGLYGYAATDDPNLFQPYPFWNFSAYVVLDNDFAPQQFTEGASGFAAFEIAAAHELYHAFQYAYDATDDNWFMQASASWAEDEIFDDVNLNRVWLPYSALGRPDVPLDFGEGPFQYANWIFLRYLSERFGSDVIRHVWALADSSPEGIDLYSVRAIKKAVRLRGARWTQVFADFGVANRIPAQSYVEGTHYPATPAASTHRLSRIGARVETSRVVLDHLTNQYVSFVPSGASMSRARLRVDVTIPKRAWGRAALIVQHKGGPARVWRIGVDRKGRGWRRVPFDPAEVESVDLVFTNASIAYRCWQGIDFVDDEIVTLPFACSGKPLHDGLVYRFKARVVS